MMPTKNECNQIRINFQNVVILKFTRNLTLKITHFKNYKVEQINENSQLF